jgi:hypothetical protein
MIRVPDSKFQVPGLVLLGYAFFKTQQNQTRNSELGIRNLIALEQP